MTKYFAFCVNKYLNYSCLIFCFTSTIVLLYSLSVNNIWNYWRLSGTLILLQLASFLIGSFLGFLFGFPAHNNAEFPTKYQRNSSLKEITSWLTKIIVGVTLIELKDIFIYSKAGVIELSNYLTNDNSQVIIIGSLIGVYFVLGFIVLYILSVTTIFEELVLNDRNIDLILSDQTMNPNSLNIDNILTSDFSQIDSKVKEEVLKYVSNNGVGNLEPLLTKRLGKFLFAMKEYDVAARAYESAYFKNKEDKYSLLNACSIRNKFLKEFDKSNNTLKEFITNNPDFAPAYYNLACNYNREYTEFRNTGLESEYIENLKTKAANYLKKAFELDKGLYSEALRDQALDGMEIAEIFKSSKKNETE